MRAAYVQLLLHKNLYAATECNRRSVYKGLVWIKPSTNHHTIHHQHNKQYSKYSHKILLVESNTIKMSLAKGIKDGKRQELRMQCVMDGVQ